MTERWLAAEPPVLEGENYWYFLPESIGMHLYDNNMPSYLT
jgi:hypothetical protein